jgi:hypothetical protein
MNCRFCSATLSRTFVDLGMQPLSNAYVKVDDVDRPEVTYPLHVRVCDECLLVQLPEHTTRESIFSDYAYLSSMSPSWVEHARRFAVAVTDRFGLGKGSRVVELASNDGYLLRHFRDLGVPTLGVEPAANVAEIARQGGVPTICRFFGRELARELVRDFGHADLLVANNVVAHVPDLNDFVSGMSALLARDGVVSVEFPHLANLLGSTQFDTIYHEHFSYFSLGTFVRVLEAHELEAFDVEELSTHGGSLRVFAQHAGAARPASPAVRRLLAEEERSGARSLARYAAFAAEVEDAKRSLLTLLIQARSAGLRVAGYGAPAKGNTLLNYAGVRTDFLDYTVDRNPLKQGTFLPGTRIPVHAPGRIAETRPDVVVILPWNLEEEIRSQLHYVRDWGGRLVVPIPRARYLA